MSTLKLNQKQTAAVPWRSNRDKISLDGDGFMMGFIYELWIDTINVWGDTRNITPRHIFKIDTNMTAGKRHGRAYQHRMKAAKF